MFNKSIVLLLGLLLFHSLAQAQNEVLITGTVLDSSTGQPIPYATVAVAKNTANELLSGTTTANDGTFAVKSPSAEVYLIASFIGYQTDTVTALKRKGTVLVAGDILLKENAQLLNEFEVEGEVSKTVFKLDKRVFNVGKDLSTTGASALEVLNNVPSVTVNIEGEISLRGNAGVQILIDGKPSVLADGSGNALGTITADMIESIEVITNPSAKYDASGTSGILNIILKKEQKKGLNGSVSLNVGIPDNNSIGFSVNRRTEKFNLFAQGGVGYRSLPRYAESVNRSNLSGTTVSSFGDSFRNENFYNIRLGTDYYMDSLTVLTLSGSFAYEIESSPSRTDFRLLDSIGATTSRWFRIEDTEATNPKWQFDLQYKKEFKDDEDHTLLISGLGSFFGKNQSSVFTETTLEGADVALDQLTATKFQRADYTLKLDYTDPLSEKVTIETGAQYEISDVGNDYAVSDLVDGDYVPDFDLTNDFSFDQKVLGAYTTVAFEGEKAGLKAGLRVENTDLKTLLVNTNESNDRNFTNLFPSAHTSYKVNERLSFQAGYSKRIARPRLWDLNPFFNITNNFNIRTGNPDLLPVFTDSYELTSILLLKKASLNASVYHRFAADVLERITTVVDNVSTTTPENIGTNATTGFEVNGKYSPKKWLTFNGDFNVNYFDRRGEFEGTSFDFIGNRWNGRLTSKLKFQKDIEFELTGNHRSGYPTVQGQISATTFLDVGIRKKIMNGKIVANLGVRDVFASRFFEHVIDQEDSYVYAFNQRGRFITFGVSYGFGKGEAMSYSGRRR